MKALRHFLSPSWHRQLVSTVQTTSFAPSTILLPCRTWSVQKRRYATPVRVGDFTGDNHSDHRQKIVILGSGWAGMFTTISFAAPHPLIVLLAHAALLTFIRLRPCPLPQ
jgi:hypothetical protein